MASEHGISAGEIGGIFAGTVTLLVTIGGGIRWWLRWTVRRDDSRAARLKLWSEELNAREGRLDLEREQHIARINRDFEEVREQYARLRREHDALYGAYHLLAGALRVVDPPNEALRLADELLRAVFPPNPTVPADMAAALGMLDQAEGAADRRTPARKRKTT